MSRGRRPLSKRSSVWESTFTLPNYTRPQGWAVVDPGKAVEASPEELDGVILDILQKEFGGLTLSPAEMDECIEFIGQMSTGYGISYNKLARIIGTWLSSHHNQPQTEYDEGYRELSFN